MRSVDRLVAEHELIERALRLLELAVARIEAGQATPEGFAAWSCAFFQRFADQCHHAKEEDVFFPRIEQRGIPREGGPIGVMLHEHVLGRDCVARMLAASQAEPLDGAAFAAAGRMYVPLLRQHIFKENNVLFRMAEQVLSPADDDEITARFDRVEHERGLEGWRESFSADVERWERAFA